MKTKIKLDYHSKFSNRISTYLKMFEEIQNVFSVVKIYQRFFNIFDFSIIFPNKFATKPRDFIRLILFEMILVIFFHKLWSRNFSFMNTNSNILNAGLDGVLSVGMFSALFLKAYLFWKRFTIWQIIVKIHKIDLIVSFT